MAVPPIPTEHLVALLGGAGIPSRKEPPVHNPSVAHYCAELFFVAVLLIALWAIGASLMDAEEHHGL